MGDLSAVGWIQRDCHLVVQRGGIGEIRVDNLPEQGVPEAKPTAAAHQQTAVDACRLGGWPLGHRQPV